MQECFYVFLVGVITVLRIWNGKNPLHNTPALPTQLLYSKMNLKPSGATCQPSGPVGTIRPGCDWWRPGRSRPMRAAHPNQWYSGHYCQPPQSVSPVSTGKYLVKYFLSEIQLNYNLNCSRKFKPKWLPTNFSTLK